MKFKHVMVLQNWIIGGQEFPSVLVYEDNENFYQFHKETRFYRKAKKEKNKLNKYGEWQRDDLGLFPFDD